MFQLEAFIHQIQALFLRCKLSKQITRWMRENLSYISVFS